MRYPVSPLLWMWPPLWPFLSLITVVWTLTFWLTWLLGHLTLTVVMSWGLLSVGAPWYYFGIIWVVATTHLYLYIWRKIAKARKRRRNIQRHRAWYAQNSLGGAPLHPRR